MCWLFFLSVWSFSSVSCQSLQDTLSYREILNISYLLPAAVKVDSLQRLNLLIPQGVDNPPLFMWIGGGAWSFVDRHIEMDLARKFAREGIAVATIGHRLSKGTFQDTTRTSGVIHPAHILDVAAAFHWLHTHGNTYGYNPDQIVVGGFSSGAHLAALLAMDPKYLEAHQLDLQQIRAILPVSGTYDIHGYYAVFAEHENPETRALAETHVKDVFGPISQFTDASPVTYLDNLKIPMLLISDNALYPYTQDFETQIRASTYRNCQVWQVFHLSHGGLWRDLSFAPQSQTRKLMIDFIRQHTQS